MRPEVGGADSPLTRWPPAGCPARDMLLRVGRIRPGVVGAAMEELVAGQFWPMSVEPAEVIDPLAWWPKSAWETRCRPARR